MLKHLTLNEMGSLISRWVVSPKRKEAFLSIPEIAGLHSKVVLLHGELLAAQPSDAAMSPELRAVVEEASKVDAVHDALARAVHSGVLADRAYALAEKPPAVARARRADEWLAKLFPEGLAIINASHLAESGNTARIAALLEREPQLAAFLAAIPVQKHGTLLAVTERWIAAGKKLAKLEEQREELEADEATTPLSKEAVNRLRARWIRLVSQVLSVLELSDADPKAIALVRRPILKASARAAKRYDAPIDAAEAAAEAEEDEGEDEEIDEVDAGDEADDEDDDGEPNTRPAR